MKLIFNIMILFSLTANLVSAEIILQNPDVNKQAPIFSAIDSYGQEINLLSFKGKPVILEWSNHECPYVARHYKENNMQKVQKIAQEEGFIWLTIISSTPGEQGHVTPEQANELTQIRDAHPTHIVLDESGEIGMKYGAKTTPHMYMIDAKGILRYKGAIDDIGAGMKFFSASFTKATNYISSQIFDVKNNNSLAINSTVAYGCSVKYNYD
tara:strand:- start:1201 stop:1833 length:633 start_codon:yes stop_codon:yes gene_type:complete